MLTALHTGSMVNPIKRYPQAKLSDFTTFKLGGPCRLLIECTTPQELIDTVYDLNQSKTTFILIGGGSNLVVSDLGLDCTVIRYISPSVIINRHDNQLTVGAGTLLDDLALWCVNEGLEGINFASGIPGTVGGAVVGNAGAWGKQVGDIFISAQIIDKQGNLKTVDTAYMCFAYRHTHLKETEDIIVSVTFNLTNGDPITLAQERAQILKMRQEKHPDLNTHPCAGSFFRNIEPTSKADRRQAAGWFLEQAGGKNLSSGGAFIFDKHANIIVKGPSGTAQDVYDLQHKMIDLVKTKFGFTLNREVRFVGPFNAASGVNPEGFW